jgi:hypothetical protein
MPAAANAGASKSAERLTHENQRFRHSRDEAAAIIAKAIGTPYMPETLRKSGCPYAVISGYTRYSDADLAVHAKAILDRAIRRCARLAQRPARPMEGIGDTA